MKSTYLCFLGNSTVQTNATSDLHSNGSNISASLIRSWAFLIVQIYDYEKMENKIRSKTKEKGPWRINPCHSTRQLCQSLIRDRQILTRPESVLFSFSFSSSVTKILLLNMNVYATAFFISSLVQARVGSGTDHQLCVYVPIRIQTYRTPYRFDLYA